MGEVMTTLNDQIELEKDCFDLGVTRYRNNVRKLQEKGRASATKHGQALMYHQIQALSDVIEEARPSKYKGGQPILRKTRGVSADKLAFITISCVIDQMVRKGSGSYTNSVLSVAKSVGL